MKTSTQAQPLHPHILFPFSYSIIPDLTEDIDPEFKLAFSSDQLLEIRKRG